MTTGTGDLSDLVEFQEEIGQSTFVELISVRKRELLALPIGTPTVENSWRRIAFGRGVREQAIQPAEPSQLVAVEQQAVSYSLIARNSKPRTTLGSALREVLVNFSHESETTSCVASDIQLLIGWIGTPRNPVNLFNIIARYKIRNASNPLDTTTTSALATADGHLSSTGCSFWKQHGPGGRTSANITNRQLNRYTLDDYAVGDTEVVENRTNWMWAVPGPVTTGTAINEYTLHRFPDPPDTGILESISFLILLNSVTDGSAVGGGDGCLPDPASELEVILRYTNHAGRSKEFAATLRLSDILSQTVDDITGWDGTAATGGGYTGEFAAWESAEFVLDSPNGTGLDQCTEPLIRNITGTGAIQIPTIGCSAQGVVAEPCDPSVTVTELVVGVATNEVQAIELPGQRRGTWNIRFEYNGIEEEASLLASAGASDLESALENFENIGNGNVRVSGTGSPATPFIIEFIGDLAATSVPLLEVDDTNLSVPGHAQVRTIIEGTRNERQTITKNVGTVSGLLISFNGVNSITLPHNASIDQVQAALEAMVSIGNGNVVVTGETPYTDAAYNGPWHIEFVGDFAGDNVPSLGVSGGYTVQVDWHGGVGAGEQQEVSISASSGTFTLTIFNQSASQSATTAQLAHNASATTIKGALDAIAGFITSDDIDVASAAPSAGFSNRFIITFLGQYFGLNMPQIVVNTSTLNGIADDVTVTEITPGLGISEQQLVSVNDADGGTFTLTAVIDDNEETTAALAHNISATDLQTALVALPSLGGDDVAVSEHVDGLLVAFSATLGPILPLTPDATNLTCDNSQPPVVGPGPYEYRITEEPVGVDLPTMLCGGCDGAAASFLVFERDLFDPNRRSNGELLTIRQLALLKNLVPNDYTPYQRLAGTLEETSYSRQVATGDSFVLIRTQDDGAATRRGILAHLANTREILPMRVVL